ncbi:MAG: DUF7670 domain-containing protein [Vicinamibacterales bacterium]
MARAAPRFIAGEVMKDRYALVLWSARILGIGIGIFLSGFALDAVEAGQPFSQTVADVLVHLLPSLGILAIVVLSWRRQWIGGLAFLILAAGYAVEVRFRLDWVLVISGPLLIAGLLFLWAWRLRAVWRQDRARDAGAL